MRESVKVCVVSTLERSSVANYLNKIAHLFSKYICRLIGARELRRGLKRLLHNNLQAEEELINLKSSLDYSAIKNRILRAIHKLSCLKKVNKRAIISAAKEFDLDCEDLDFFYRSLTKKDLRQIAKYKLSISGFSDSEVLRILKQIEYLARSLVRRKLMFVLANDPMVETIEDLLSPLQIHVLKIIREYEIQDISYEHMLAKVINGIQNEACNMAGMYGRDKRRPVLRVSESDPFRLVWYLDIHGKEVYAVKVFPDKKLRRKIGDSICIAVQNAETDEWMAVHHKRLYDSREEATDALERRLQGQRSKREAYLDPSPQTIIDFQPSSVSLDNEDNTEGSFHEYVADEEERVDISENAHRIRQLINGLPQRSREFAELVFCSEVDELFDAWCEANGFNINSCDHVQLGRLACKYLGVTKMQLRADLAESPASLWEDGQRELILRSLSSPAVATAN